MVITMKEETKQAMSLRLVRETGITSAALSTHIIYEESLNLTTASTGVEGGNELEGRAVSFSSKQKKSEEKGAHQCLDLLETATLKDHCFTLIHNPSSTT